MEDPPAARAAGPRRRPAAARASGRNAAKHATREGPVAARGSPMATAAGNPAATGLPSFEVGESDDFVEYWLHLQWEGAEAAGPEAMDAAAMRAALQAHCVLCLDFVRQWTDGYIWQRDPFVLIPCPAFDADGKATPCLYGRTYWGENIDDEWFIVWLLLQITKRWPGAVVSVVDNDGQFLLIEACEQIPRWVKPDNAAHRVQIAAGSIHLVPLSVQSPLTATTAVAAVRAPESVSPTLASPVVQKVIAARLEQFEPAPPLLARPQLTHRARLYLPADIFRVLSEHPYLVAPAVEAFFARDPIDMRLCNKMAAFPCNTRRFGLVNFSRCLYAQLHGQRCKPPRCFGEIPAEGSAERKAFELGMKLACGFEILLQTGRRNLKRAGSAASAAATSVAPPVLDAEYNAALERCGYYEQRVGLERTAADQYAAAVLQRVENDTEVLLEDGSRFGGGGYETGDESETREPGSAMPRSKASASLVHSRSVRSASIIEQVLAQGMVSESASVAVEAGTGSVGTPAGTEADRARRGRVAALGAAEMLTATSRDQDVEEEEEEDDDDWLAVSESDVDQMLRNLSGGSDRDDSTNYVGGGSKPRGQGGRGAAPRSEEGPPTSAEQAEMEALTARMSAFLDQSSDLDGVRGVGKDGDVVRDDETEETGGVTTSGDGASEHADNGEGASLEMDKILKLMEGLMAGSLPDGADAHRRPGASDDEEDDEFYDGPAGTEDSDSSDETADGNLENAEADEEAREYMERMDTELKLGAGGLGDPSLGSRLGESFIRRPAVVPSEGAAARAAAAAVHGNADKSDGEAGVRGEVDLDWNLVQNLVESFNSQEGGAGPTTNLLSMLGGSLPASATKRG
jgi:hypothetical protein